MPSMRQKEIALLRYVPRWRRDKASLSGHAPLRWYTEPLRSSDKGEHRIPLQHLLFTKSYRATYGKTLFSSITCTAAPPPPEIEKSNIQKQKLSMIGVPMTDHSVLRTSQ